MISKTQISAQKLRGRQLDAKVCGCKISLFRPLCQTTISRKCFKYSRPSFYHKTDAYHSAELSTSQRLHRSKFHLTFTALPGSFSNVVRMRTRSLVPKGASPNYKITSLWPLSWNPPPPPPPLSPPNVTPLISSKIIVRRRSPLLLTCHYPCVCRINTARWTAHTELLDGRKLHLLSPEARRQTVSSVYTDSLLADKTPRG